MLLNVPQCWGIEQNINYTVRPVRYIIFKLEFFSLPMEWQNFDELKKYKFDKKRKYFNVAFCSTHFWILFLNSAAKFWLKNRNISNPLVDWCIIVFEFEPRIKWIYFPTDITTLYNYINSLKARQFRDAQFMTEIVSRYAWENSEFQTRKVWVLSLDVVWKHSGS